MDHGHTAAESLILLTAMVLPALVLAAFGQISFLKKRGVSPARRWLSLLPMFVLSTVLTTILFVFGSNIVPRSLQMQDIFLDSSWFPFLPLAFVVVAVVSPAISLWLARRV
jgi:hypothetical protein